MSAYEFFKFEKISLKSHPEISEKWVQDRIAEDPSILGLGDIILKDKERIQPRAGRLDLLFQDSESNLRYEVEIQLGRTDESHIIRTIEYWDVERKRYPQYDHVAVIIAEDITSRFLNVISLFNGYIPIIAIQMNAIKDGNRLSLVFTTVLDQISLGMPEEDEVEEQTDRNYWTKRGTPKTVGIADNLLNMIKSFDPRLELKYNKFYIGLAHDGQPNNFVLFKPKKKFTIMSVKLKKDPAWSERFDESGLDFIDYHKNGRYRIRLFEEDVEKHRELFQELLKQSYEEATS